MSVRVSRCCINYMLYTNIMHFVQDDAIQHTAVPLVDIIEDDTVENVVILSDLESGMHK